MKKKTNHKLISAILLADKGMKSLSADKNLNLVNNKLRMQDIRPRNVGRKTAFLNGRKSWLLKLSCVLHCA